MTVIKPTVTDESIEKAARALWGEPGWEQASPEQRQHHREAAERVVLSVAHDLLAEALYATAPLIAGQALRDFAASMDSKEWGHQDDWGVNCAYAFEVRARADQIEAGR